MEGHDQGGTNTGGANFPPARDGMGKYARTLEGAERDAEAARLKSQRWTFQQIADHLGYASKSSAYAAVARALAAVPVEDVTELRRVALGEIDYLVAAAQEILDHDHLHVSQGGKVVRDDDGELVLDDGPKIAAIRELRMLNERRARIQGSDVPVKSTVTVDGTLDERSADLLARIAQAKALAEGLGGAQQS